MRTERLLLRPWREADRESFAALNADPAVMAWLQGVLTRAESDGFVDRIRALWAENGYGLWAVEVPSADFIGYVGLHPATFEAPFTPAVEVGWRLARPHWGHGYATEAARAAIRFGYDVAGLAEVLSFTAATNLRSRAVMERVGLVHDLAGDFEHPNLPQGHPLRPHVLYRSPERI